MTAAIQFQLAQTTDFPGLLSMMKEFYAIDGYPFDQNLVEKNLAFFTASENFGKVWLIKDGENIAGYVILSFCFSFEFGGRTAFIDELFLKPAHRSKGIGATIIDFVQKEAKALGIRALHLEVERHNEKGNKLYLKKGFTEHKRFLMTHMIQ